MARMYVRFWSFIHDERGATAIEYGLIATLVSVAIIAGLTILGDGLDGAFTALGTAVGPAAPAAP